MVMMIPDPASHRGNAGKKRVQQQVPLASTHSREITIPVNRFLQDSSKESGMTSTMRCAKDKDNGPINQLDSSLFEQSKNRFPSSSESVSSNSSTLTGGASNQSSNNATVIMAGSDQSVQSSSIMPENTEAIIRLRDKGPKEVVMVMHEYRSQRGDELNLKRGSRIEVLSKDHHLSGGVGWWTGIVREDDGKGIEASARIGVFPSNFVEPDIKATLETYDQPIPNIAKEPPEIVYSDLLYNSDRDAIGSGAFATVYKGTLLTTSEIVAIKVAKVRENDDIRAIIENVRQEARVFHMLDHPNIVKLKGVCSSVPNLCLVMEHCAGGSLNRLLAGRKISAEILVDWAIQIAKGMYYLHEGLAPFCVLHRDLKTTNVLSKEPIVNNNFKSVTLKISDFGVAREVCGTTRMSVGGTYNWMAPEAIRNSIFSKASDVWSFGVVIWELLTGDIPYKGIEISTVIYHIALNKLSLPIPATCPAPFSQLMKDCWNLEPHERPSFGQLIQRLEELRQTCTLEDESFHSMQESWRQEIPDLYFKLKDLEHELHMKVEALQNREREQEAKEERLRQYEENLQKRERQLIEQELINLLNKSQQPPRPPRRQHGLLGKVIGNPIDFRPVISVKRVSKSRASSESPPKSPGPGEAHGELRIVMHPQSPADERGLSIPGIAVSKRINGDGTMPKVAKPRSPLLEAGISRVSPNRNGANFLECKFNSTSPNPVSPSPSKSPGTMLGDREINGKPIHHRSTPNLNNKIAPVSPSIPSSPSLDDSFSPVKSEDDDARWQHYGSGFLGDIPLTPRHNALYRSKHRKSSGWGIGGVQNALRQVGSMLMGVVLKGHDPIEDVVQHQQEQQARTPSYHSTGAVTGTAEWFSTFTIDSRRLPPFFGSGSRNWAPSYSLDDPRNCHLLQHQSSVSTPSSTVNSPFRQFGTMGSGRKESYPNSSNNSNLGFSPITMSQPTSYSERSRGSPAPSITKVNVPHKNPKGVPQPTPNYKSYVKTPVNERKKRMAQTPQQQLPPPYTMPTHHRAHSSDWQQRTDTPSKQAASQSIFSHTNSTGVIAVSNPSYEHYTFPLGHAPVNGPPQRPLTLDIRHPETAGGATTSGATPGTPAESGISTGGSSYRSFPVSADASTTSAPFGVIGSTPHLLDLPSDGQTYDRTPPLIQADATTLFRAGAGSNSKISSSRRTPMNEDIERDFTTHPLSPVASSP